MAAPTTTCWPMPWPCWTTGCPICSTSTFTASTTPGTPTARHAGGGSRHPRGGRGGGPVARERCPPIRSSSSLPTTACTRWRRKGGLGNHGQLIERDMFIPIFVIDKDIATVNSEFKERQGMKRSQREQLLTSSTRVVWLAVVAGRPAAGRRPTWTGTLGVSGAVSDAADA